MVLRALIFTVCLCLGASATQATTVLKVDTPQLVETSEWVVRATVVEVRTEDLRAEGRAIFTDVEFAVHETYKGLDVPVRYTMRLLGGTGADGITMKIPGMPVFVPGEEVVLFLERTSMGHIPCGLGQGVYRVLYTPAGDTWVRQSAGDAHLVERGPEGHLRAAHKPLAASALPLDALLWDVLEALYPTR